MMFCVSSGGSPGSAAARRCCRPPNWNNTQGRAEPADDGENGTTQREAGRHQLAGQVEPPDHHPGTDEREVGDHRIEARPQGHVSTARGWTSVARVGSSSRGAMLKPAVTT